MPAPVFCCSASGAAGHTDAASRVGAVLTEQITDGEEAKALLPQPADDPGQGGMDLFGGVAGVHQHARHHTGNRILVRLRGRRGVAGAYPYRKHRYRGGRMRSDQPIGVILTTEKTVVVPGAAEEGIRTWAFLLARALRQQMLGDKGAVAGPSRQETASGAVSEQQFSYGESHI